MALSFSPLRNLSQTLLLDWVLLHTRGLSIQSVEKLVKEVLLHPSFDIADLHNFNMRRALKDLDDDTNGFKKESIDLRLPFQAIVLLLSNVRRSIQWKAFPCEVS